MSVRPLLAALYFFPLLAAAQGLHAADPRTPVIVELFTSEGCSSCPPADALLARLDREQPIPSAEIVVLGEHVDYWNSLGWRDRFSAHQFTERQAQYASSFHLDDVYTPQMVVGGASQINGSDARAAAQAIVRAAQAKTLPLELTAARLDGGRISATVRLSAAGASATNADLYAALVTPAASTQVRSGENGGHTLQHAGIVRSLRRIGSLHDLLSGPLAFALDAPSDSEQPLRLVVFAQRPGPGAILGATTRPVGHGSEAQAATVATRLR